MVMVVITWMITFFCGVVAMLYCWNGVRYNRKRDLPPGTMGWPVFGETYTFLKHGQQFIKQRKARYGDLFKSHILGHPTVISTDPKLNRYILLNESQGLIPGYPQSMLDLLGEWNIAAVHGAIHKSMRGAMFALVNPTSIKDHLLNDIDEFMSMYFRDWDGQVISMQDKTKEMALLLHFRLVMSLSPGPKAEEMRKEFYKLVEGTLSMPVNLPGTRYREGFQARRKILGMLSEILHERKLSKDNDRHNDMITMLLNVEEDGSFSKSRLGDDQIMDSLIAIINAGYETVSTTSMMAVKYLHDCPKALRELREEHLAILRNKKDGEKLTWDDYKSMKFTHSVIYETLRLATVVNGVLRKATRDMEMKGFTIPKGWKIYVYMAETNQDSFMYPDPFTFKPWRWQEENGDSSLYFMSFGGGNRLCPGKDLGMVEVSMFLHHFVTKYRWKEIGGERIVKFPRVEATNGLRIQVSQCSLE